jgi:hypothetical protein
VISLFSPHKSEEREAKEEKKEKNENSLEPAAAGRNFSASKRTPAYSFHLNTRTRAERTSKTNTNNDG